MKLFKTSNIRIVQLSFTLNCQVFSLLVVENYF